MIDGLDEVPSSSKERFIAWLSTILARSGTPRCIVTCRSSGYRFGDLQAAPTQHYHLLPFAEEQSAEFASRWFADRASRFTREFEAIFSTRVHHTPLLLTIAAKVFAERGELPRSQSALYETVIEVMLDEALRRMPEDQLGDRVAKLMRATLGELARYFLTGDAGWRQCSEFVAEYLRRTLGLSGDESRVDAKRLVDAMCAHSGLVARSLDGALAFIHPTFQDYFVAERIVELNGGKLSGIWNDAIAHWRNRDWREVSLLTLGLLSEQRVGVSTLLGRVLGRLSPEKVKQLSINCDQYEFLDRIQALTFVTEAVAQNVSIDISLTDRLARLHLASLGAHRDENSVVLELLEIPEGPLEALRVLPSNQVAIDGLRALVGDEPSRYLEYHLLCTLLDLAPTDAHVAMLVAWVNQTNDLDEDPVAQIFDVCDKLLGHDRRRDAFEVLMNSVEDGVFFGSHVYGVLSEYLIGFVDLPDARDSVRSAFRALLDVVHEQSELERVVGALVDARTDLGREILLEFGANEELDPWLRCDAAVGVLQLGHIADACAVFRSIVRNDGDSYAAGYASDLLRQARMLLPHENKS